MAERGLQGGRDAVARFTAALGAAGRSIAALGAATGVAAAALAAPAQTHTVVIDGMRFVPETLTVRRGDMVQWVNKDLFPHTATAHGGFDSGSIAPQASWTHVVRDAGTLPYVCTLHPTMKGTLVVQ